MLIVPNLRGLQLPCHVSVTYCSKENTEANRFNDLPAELSDSAAAVISLWLSIAKWANCYSEER